MGAAERAAQPVDERADGLTPGGLRYVPGAGAYDEARERLGDLHALSFLSSFLS
jgi:hypothetical protein